ncbi:MAG: zf-HC2 domain-containing protein, partial [Candidatus Eisenbacteria bacterium]
MTDRFTDMLSDHLDGGLARSDQSALEEHLAGCQECRNTLTDLRLVKERAHSLVDPLAPDDLWAGIASRIGTAGTTGEPVTAPAPTRSVQLVQLPRRRTFTWHVPQLVAAGFLVFALGATALYFAFQQGVRRGAHEQVARAESPGTVNRTSGGTKLASFDAEKVEGEIALLKTVLERGREKLDPRTITVLEKNLQLIAQATAEAKRALAADPANQDLQ